MNNKLSYDQMVITSLACFKEVCNSGQYKGNN